VSADWTAIKAEYINSRISTRSLAQKHGVPYPTLRKRAEKENWVQERAQQERKTVAEVSQKTAEAVATAEAERATVLCSISTKAARFLDERLDNLIGSGAKAYEIKAIMETARIIRDMDKDSAHAEDDPLMKYLEEMRNA